MLKHIVMWKLKASAEGRTKQENAKLMKEKLENLQEMISEIEIIEVGININQSDAAFDVTLYSEFRDEEALVSYQKHPEHVKVADFVGKIVNERAVVDYIV
ncbi:Dabb family protein [Methanolobus zinderi]|uniref:Dabb family protein n=1 Tax=Methanolobus zinderi TaxID=536044 RepID=A0A7D5I590_9EURY|nr:Dabb family protein [Methanolobus zinderi]QLC50081.1 Dabb family protein [Methanolobus zinderi]